MKFSRFKNNQRFRKKTLQCIKHFIIEFILIFLGVLLALQFDQYESDKSMEKQKLRYKKELLKELRHDKNLLSYSKSLLVENVDYLSQIEKRIKNNSSIDTIIKIVRSELDFKSYVYGVTYNHVFKSMVYEDDVWLLDCKKR
jgi:hypothetical protein